MINEKETEAECIECGWEGAVCDMQECTEMEGFYLCPKCNGENIFYN